MADFVAHGDLDLFDQILDRTEDREAFSPLKEAAMSYSPLDDMRALRSEVVDAATEADLYYALVKLSNARRDHHLTVTPADDGLRPPQVADVAAPIRVLPDYSNRDSPSIISRRISSLALCALM